MAAGSQGVQLMSVPSRSPHDRSVGCWDHGASPSASAYPWKSISKASHRVIVAGSQGMCQAGYCLNLEQEDWLPHFRGVWSGLQEAQSFSTLSCSFFFLRGNHFLPQWGE